MISPYPRLTQPLAHLRHPHQLRPLVAALGLVAAVSSAIPALAGERLAGRTHVLDGDTVVVGDITIRLKGIAAPEVAHFDDPGEPGGQGVPGRASRGPDGGLRPDPRADPWAVRRVVLPPGPGHRRGGAALASAVTARGSAAGATPGLSTRKRSIYRFQRTAGQGSATTAALIIMAPACREPYLRAISA